LTEKGHHVRPAGGEEQQPLTAESVSRLVAGDLRGDGAVLISGVAPLARAGERDLSLLASPRFLSQFTQTRAAAVLVAPELADSAGPVACRIVVDRPYDAMTRVLPALYPPPPPPGGIHASAVVHPDAVLSDDVTIGPFCVIGAGARLGPRAWLGAHCVIGDGVEVGEDCRLHDSVTLQSGTRLGRRVQLHAGVRVGGDGFGYVFGPDGHRKVPHVGRCIIEDDVEIGANSTVDRGSIDDTVIGAGSKLDNLVHVAHNVRIGRLCVLMAQVGIAGSTTIEDGCVLAGQAGIGGHVTIGAGARIGGQAGVFGDVPAGQSWSGYPARPHRESLRAHAALHRLSELMKELERLLQRERS
jgi:UDP-3-O-[3-hydroxymyristoyl] glucosamine N-acyltransferase